MLLFFLCTHTYTDLFFWFFSPLPYIDDNHGSHVYSLGKYKKMVGSQGGSKEKVKMEHFDTLVDIGKQESYEDGMDAQIYLVNLMKTSSIL